MSYMTKADLAAAYFPDSTPTAASKLLQREMEHSPGLLAALEATGYTKTKRQFSPRQVAIIAQYLGEP